MASESSAPPVTALDKAMMVPHVARCLIAAMLRLITRPIDSSAKPAALFKDVIFAALRANLSGLNVAQEQWLNGRTDLLYNDFIAKKHQANYTDELSSGLKVHWMGNKLARYTILYLHGGGFNLAISEGHLAYLWEIKEHLEQHHSISIAIPTYTLAPMAKYPTQIKQSVEALEFLVKDCKRNPSNIMIAGDSAGGNLATAVLSHLLHPHPDIPELKLNQPLCAAILISPWVYFVPEGGSAKSNETSDMVTTTAAKRWSSAYMGDAKQDNYNQPYFADSNWFTDLNKVVREILMYGGDQEVLIDSIDEFAKKLKAAHGNVEYVKQPGACHVDMVIDKLLGYSQTSEGGKLIESWIAGRMERVGY